MHYNAGYFRRKRIPIMTKLQERLQKLAGKLPEGVAGTRSVTELSGDELRSVSGGSSRSGSSVYQTHGYTTGYVEFG